MYAPLPSIPSSAYLRTCLCSFPLPKTSYVCRAFYAAANRYSVMRYKPGYKPSPQGMLLPQPPPKQPKHTSERNPFLGIAEYSIQTYRLVPSCILLHSLHTPIYKVRVCTSIYNNPVCSARGRLPLQCTSQCLPCHAAQLQLHPKSYSPDFILIPPPLLVSLLL